MAVTLETLKTETLRKLQESTTSPNSLFKSDDFLDWANEYYDSYEAEMELEGAPVEYTWAAGASSVALSTISATLIQIRYMEVLDSAGEVTGKLVPRPKGEKDGFFVWNDTVYLNGDAPTSAMTVKVWPFRKATRATAISDNADVHSGNERAVLIPWFLHQAQIKEKNYAVSDGYFRLFDTRFKRMMKKRRQQANPAAEAWGVSDDWESYTAG
jgi:hypothetical protein